MRFFYFACTIFLLFVPKPAQATTCWATDPPVSVEDFIAHHWAFLMAEIISINSVVAEDENPSSCDPWYQSTEYKPQDKCFHYDVYMTFKVKEVFKEYIFSKSFEYRMGYSVKEDGADSTENPYKIGKEMFFKVQYPQSNFELAYISGLCSNFGFSEDELIKALRARSE